MQSASLLSGTQVIWKELKRLARSCSQAFVAVPYFGKGANDMLPMPAGSVLVVKFDMSTVTCGQVDPREIVKAIKRGVQVYSCANLHAKVFVCGKTLVIGSSNVSGSSANYLIEACVRSTAQHLVKRAKTFVRDLTGDQIGLEYAKKMIQFYHPPKVNVEYSNREKKRKATPHQSNIHWLPLIEGAWDDADRKEEKKSWDSAKKDIKDQANFKLDDFRWWSKAPITFRRGERVIACTKYENRKILVSPPARITRVHKYSVRGKYRAIVYLEMPKKLRQRNLRMVMKKLGAAKKLLGNPRRSKLLKNPEVVYGLGHVWSAKNK